MKMCVCIYIYIWVCFDAPPFLKHTYITMPGNGTALMYQNNFCRFLLNNFYAGRLLNGLHKIVVLIAKDEVSYPYDYDRLLLPGPSIVIDDPESALHNR